MQDYNFTLWYILRKTNTRTDILLKNQMDIKEDNKNIKMFKDKLWKRKLVTKLEIVMFRENQIIKKTTLLKEI